eukprot:1561397-Rhodomonas_salina.1
MRAVAWPWIVLRVTSCLYQRDPFPNTSSAIPFTLVFGLDVRSAVQIYCEKHKSWGGMRVPRQHTEIKGIPRTLCTARASFLV